QLAKRMFPIYNRLTRFSPAPGGRRRERMARTWERIAHTRERAAGTQGVPMVACIRCPHLPAQVELWRMGSGGFRSASLFIADGPEGRPAVFDCTFADAAAGVRQ